MEMMKVVFLVLLIACNSDSVYPISGIEWVIIEASPADIMLEIGLDEVQMSVQIIREIRVLPHFSG